MELLAGLILEGAVVSGDAMFCQKELCAEVVDHTGDYLFVVKDNQPTLQAAIAEALETPVSPLKRSSSGRLGRARPSSTPSTATALRHAV
jgi:hypothetical protein